MIILNGLLKKAKKQQGKSAVCSYCQQKIRSHTHKVQSFETAGNFRNWKHTAQYFKVTSGWKTVLYKKDHFCQILNLKNQEQILIAHIVGANNLINAIIYWTCYLILYTLRLYFVLYLVFALVELQTVLKLKGKSATGRKGWQRDIIIM